MIKITNEVGGKKYELVPYFGSCNRCVFNSRFGCTLGECDKEFNFRHVCRELLGIWKEVRNDA